MKEFKVSPAANDSEDNFCDLPAGFLSSDAKSSELERKDCMNLFGSVLAKPSGLVEEYVSNLEEYEAKVETSLQVDFDDSLEEDIFFSKETEDSEKVESNESATDE